MSLSVREAQFSLLLLDLQLLLFLLRYHLPQHPLPRCPKTPRSESSRCPWTTIGLSRLMTHLRQKRCRNFWKKDPSSMSGRGTCIMNCIQNVMHHGWSNWTALSTYGDKICLRLGSRLFMERIPCKSRLLVIDLLMRPLHWTQCMS